MATDLGPVITTCGKKKLYCSHWVALSLHTFIYHYGTLSAAQLHNRKPPRLTYPLPTLLNLKYHFDFFVKRLLSNHLRKDI